MPDPPIPPAIWTRLLAFLRDGRTGTVTLHVHRGTICGSHFGEEVKPDPPEAVVDSR